MTTQTIVIRSITSFLPEINIQKTMKSTIIVGQIIMVPELDRFCHCINNNSNNGTRVRIGVVVDQSRAVLRFLFFEEFYPFPRKTKQKKNNKDHSVCSSTVTKNSLRYTATTVRNNTDCCDLLRRNLFS